MPKVVIPNKICPHCNGTTWFLQIRKKDGYKTYNCYKKKLESIKRWRTTTEAGKKYKANARKLESHKKAQKKFFSKPEMKALKNMYARQAFEKGKLTLNDTYVKSRITVSTKGILKHQDITQELIEIKRKQLLLNRKLESNGKNKN